MLSAFPYSCTCARLGIDGDGFGEKDTSRESIARRHVSDGYLDFVDKAQVAASDEPQSGRLERLLAAQLGTPASRFGQRHGLLIPESRGQIIMALPLVKSAVACTDFTRTVQSYIPQLNALPQQIYQSATDLQALKELYLSTNPLISAFAFSLALVPIVLVISEINRNYSQIDRIWSLLPTFYNLHYVAYAHAKGLPTQRLDSLAIISLVWSVGVCSTASYTR